MEAQINVGDERDKDTTKAETGEIKWGVQQKHDREKTDARVETRAQENWHKTKEICHRALKKQTAANALDGAANEISLTP